MIHLLVLQQVPLDDGYGRENVGVHIEPVAVELLERKTRLRGHKHHQPRTVRTKGGGVGGGSGSSGL